MNTAILLAAGSGTRMQGSVADKILAPLNGRPVFAHCVCAFLASDLIDRFTIVYRDTEQRHALACALDALNFENIQVDWVSGGTERQDSVFNALQAQQPECAWVFIHDCARPLITPSDIQKLHKAVLRDQAAVLAHPVADSIKRIPEAGTLEQIQLEDLQRNRLWAMETPQAFAYTKILQAYQHVHTNELHITDDTAAAATIGLKTTIVPSDHPNPKLTTPADLDYAEWLLQH